MEYSQPRQQTQKLSHERLELILRGMDAAPWDWDLTTGEVYFSPTWWNMLGYVDAELPATSTLMASFFHPDEAKEIDTSFTEALQSGSVWQIECRIRHKQGHYVPVMLRAYIQRNGDGKALRLSGTNTDLTERRKAEAALRESEARFRALTELSSDWYWEQDEHFRFTVLGGKVYNSTGLTMEQQLGKTRWEIPCLNMAETDWQAHRKILSAHAPFRDLEIRRPDTGTTVHWSSVSGSPIFDADGRFCGYHGIGRDISIQKQAVDEIHRLAFYDALTGLPNRRLLMEQLKRALHTNARHHRHGALLFIDLDNFKTLNDTLGHDVGDLLLQQVAQRLSICVRESDTVARLGGDEFVLEDLESESRAAALQADSVGKKILATLNEPYDLAGREHHSSPSMGITLFDVHSTSVDDLLKQADLAMYQAKAAGRNTLRFFDVSMQTELESWVAMEFDLRDGLQGGEELVLYFQPTVGAQGQVTGAEALVRWQQPTRGLVMPESFIALAESTGLIVPLGNWVMNMACQQLATWALLPNTAHLSLAVNVSARELREPGFVPGVLKCLNLWKVPPNRLRIELTESVLAHRADDIIDKMKELKAHGVGFSLDDFGTGYSSLSYLKQLPLDLLKIDRSFVRDVLTDPNDAAIARTIVALGTTLGLSVVAEGVETEAQRDFLASIGCFAYQGFLFGHPVPIEEFSSFLSPPSSTAHAFGNAQEPVSRVKAWG